VFHRSKLFVALGVTALALGSCCSSTIGSQVRQEMLVTRGATILMGGLIPMPPFTDPATVQTLVDGSSEKRIVELVGPAWRKLPATEGELWVWDMGVYRDLVSLTINVVDGRQRGPAVSEWRTIPDFMLHHSWLKPDIEVSRIVDLIGSPTRWEIGDGTGVMIWETSVQLEQDGSSWRYAPDVFLHSLRLEIVRDHLQSVRPIVSRRLDARPSSAAQQAQVSDERHARATELQAQPTVPLAPDGQRR
jgi:hypothetical protein